MDLWVITITDRLKQQIAQRLFAKRHLSENIKYLATKGVTFFIEFAEQALEHLALTGVRCDEIPQMTDLGLTNAMNASEALLKSIGIPRQIVIDHEMRTLQIDALARSIGCDEYPHVLVLRKAMLSRPAVITGHSAANHHNRIWVTQQNADFLLEIKQRVLMLRKDDELLAGAVAIEHARIILKQERELFPLSVVPALAKTLRHAFKAGQGFDFRFELGDGRRGRRGVDYAVLIALVLITVEVINIKVIILRRDGIKRTAHDERILNATSPTNRIQLVFEPTTTSAQRLINRLRGGREPPLQRCECESNAILALAVQAVRAVKLLAHICGYVVVQRFLGLRELVRNGIRPTFWEERTTVEFEQLLLDQPTHHIGYVRHSGTASMPHTKAIRINKRHEQLEIIRLAVMRSRGHQQEVLSYATEELAQLIPLCALNLTSRIGGGHLMRLITHHKIP